MRKLGKGVTGAVAVAALVGMGVAGGAAFNSPAQVAATNENVTVVYNSAAGGPVVLTGFVTDTGTDAAGKANDTLTLSQGTIVVHHESTESGGIANENDATCVATVTDAGTFTVKSGTGAYAKLKGSGTYTSSGTFIFPVGNNGNCRFSAAPLHGVDVLKATGTLSFKGGGTVS